MTDKDVRQADAVERGAALQSEIESAKERLGEVVLTMNDTRLALEHWVAVAQEAPVITDTHLKSLENVLGKLRERCQANADILTVAGVV